MKSFVSLLCGILCAMALAAESPGLSQVHTVYLLPMSGGMEQLLANRLTSGHVLQVVADPAKADAIFTDHLGAGFEAQLKELYAPPDTSGAQGDKSADKEKDSETKPVDARPVMLSSFGRGKGAFFLVHRESRAVLWSTFEKPKDSSSKELDRSAGRIASRLERALKGK